MSLNNVCSIESELCNAILVQLNNLIVDYRKILSKKGTSPLNILTHSGSAPETGWIPNTLSTVNISNAIHKYAIDKHFDAQEHYRDNYVWHAWLRNNTENLTFKHEDIEPSKLPLLKTVYFTRRTHRFNKDSSSFIDERPDSIRFKEIFNLYNSEYPNIGRIHRCLIIIRYFNEKLYLTHIEQDMELQKIYYPLFFLVNLFIHIAMIYYSLDTANYEALFLQPKFILLSNIDLRYELYLKYGNRFDESDFSNKESRKFILFKKYLEEILKKYYSRLSDLYVPIKNLVEINVDPIQKIDNLEKPYFIEEMPSPIPSETGESATGASSTGASATGASATGASALGPSALGASALGASVTGASALGASASYKPKRNESKKKKPVTKQNASKKKTSNIESKYISREELTFFIENKIPDKNLKKFILKNYESVVDYVLKDYLLFDVSKADKKEIAEYLIHIISDYLDDYSYYQGNLNTKHTSIKLIKNILKENNINMNNSGINNLKTFNVQTIAINFRDYLLFQ